MTVVLETVQFENLYYLDSLVTRNSQAGLAAKQMSIPFMARDIFIDNEKDEESIRSQLAKLKAMALKTGKAIGIGHDKPLTLQIISEVIPEWKKEGIKLVKLSEYLDK